MEKIRVLFVCTGNICRSPAAQGVFERLLAAHDLSHLVEVDSAGTHAYHVGERPDARMQAAASRRGVDLSTQRARRISENDFTRFHYIIAMDTANMRALEDLLVPGAARPVLFMSYAMDAEVDEVPDPYYGGETGFERVLDLVEEAARGLLQDIRTRRRI